MGFDIGSTGQILTFEGTPYEGLEVKVDEAPLGLLTDIMRDYAKLTSVELDPAEGAKLLASLTEGFAAVLEEWNVERKGEPVPATLEGLRSVGPKFFTALVGAWLTGTTTADEDLGKDSSSGGSSPEELTAAAALSSSLQSSDPQRLLSGSATGGTACRRRSWPSPRGCCGCSTSTTRSTRGTRREVRAADGRQLRRCEDQGGRRREA